MWQQCYFNSYLNISVVKLNQFNLLYAIGKIRQKKFLYAIVCKEICKTVEKKIESSKLYL